MNGFNRLNRSLKYALLSALAAGLIATCLIVFFIEMLNFLFIPSVVIAVFVSAYFAFRRQMRRKGELEVSRIFKLAFEVGTISHVYAFAIYLPANFFLYDFNGVDVAILFMYLGSTLVMSFFSILMFIWIAVPMYLGIGFLLKSIEKNGVFDRQFDTFPVNDEMHTNPDWDPLND